MISIIGGLKKRARISVPEKGVRPTSSKKRESIFSILESFAKKKNFNIYDKSNILDLFAGSGSLGLEAISRGAAYGYFYENNIDVINNLKKNCLKICKNEKFKIVTTDILENNFQNIDKRISIVFIDPPYKINPFEKILNNLINSKILINNAIIVIETSIKNPIQISSKFLIYNERLYGKTKIYFLIKKCLSK